jgi:hypothetical protein
MRRPAQRFRFLLAVLTTVQGAAPAAAALADAAYALDSQWAGVHIEGHSGGRHDHPPHRDDCIFCQFLGHHAVASPRTAGHRDVVLPAAVAMVAPGCPCREVPLHLPDSRAPPLA